MRLGRDAGDLNAPDTFLERNLQAKLAKLWYTTVRQMKGWQVVYDVVAVEEHYEGLRRNFISELPAVFDIDSPDEQWDAGRPEIPKQRQLLRVSIFSYLCRIYSRLLKLEPSYLQSMSRYNCNLISQHRIRLVNAAVSLLDSVAQLHNDMGRKHTKYFLISFYTFEPAMVLTIHLLNATANSSGNTQDCKEGQCHQGHGRDDGLGETSVLPNKIPNAAQCRLEIDKALERLDMLREVSSIAELASRKIHQLVQRLDQQIIGEMPDAGRGRERSGSMPSLCEPPQNSLDAFGGERYCSGETAVRQEDLSGMYQGSWVDELLEISTENSGSYRVSDSSFSASFGSFGM
ncbi:hypothetical protein G7Y79_00053g088510 [Physcia stellaris]|nr:hypothetical protein G7Y79_00053g088510 [Physcia stellaris]